MIFRISIIGLVLALSLIGCKEGGGGGGGKQGGDEQGQQGGQKEQQDQQAAEDAEQRIQEAEARAEEAERQVAEARAEAARRGEAPDSSLGFARGTPAGGEQPVAPTAAATEAADGETCASCAAAGIDSSGHRSRATAP